MRIMITVDYTTFAYGQIYFVHFNFDQEKERERASLNDRQFGRMHTKSLHVSGTFFHLSYKRRRSIVSATTDYPVDGFPTIDTAEAAVAALIIPSQRLYRVSRVVRFNISRVR